MKSSLLGLSLMLILSTVMSGKGVTASINSANSRQASDLKNNFFLICDSLVKRIQNSDSKAAYFIDSYAVRALCVAYDNTGKEQYLDACRSWSDRMVNYQEKMIPSDVYYMNYGRKPGENTGDWNVADDCCIAMGVLTTAVRSKGAERERLLQSVERFAKMVMSNYIGPTGGICNGGWSEFKDEWWCSSGLFAPLSFMLHQTTGDQKYLNTGLKALEWLNGQDLTKTKPFPLAEQGPSMPMYILETYSAGWPYLNRAHKENAIVQKINWCLDWIKEQQQVPIPNRKWAPQEWWGSKFGGLPFYQYFFSRYLSNKGQLMTQGDDELRKLTDLVFSQKLYDAQLTYFLLFSYAERVSPGRMYIMK
jgi:rhamnogalacturonyl hydrolase YesR